MLGISVAFVIDISINGFNYLNVGIFITYFGNYQTKVKLLIEQDIEERMDIKNCKGSWHRC